MKILIAEDDSVARRVLENRVTKWGYDIVSVDNGARAMEILESDDGPKLAILDWVMPGMDGLQICKSIRKQPQKDYIYILLLTSKNRQEDLVQALEAGADDFISKPPDKNELRLRLRTGKRIIQLQNELTFQTTHDFLTGLWNRFAIMSRLSTEFSRAVRHNSPLSIAMADLDRFKQINDTYGHQAGDTVLVETGARMMNTLRAYDAVGRYGGEEFLLIFPECEMKNAITVCERVRSAICETPIHLKEGAIDVTASFGISTLNFTEDTQIETMINRADNALYKAKENGRNRVETEFKSEELEEF